MMTRVVWLFILLSACRSNVVATTGEHSLTIATVQEAYKALDPSAQSEVKAQPKLWLLDLLAEDALYDEARQRGVEPDKTTKTADERAALVLGLKRAIGAATMANITMDSLTDDDLMRLYKGDPRLSYSPPRCHVSLVAFKDLAIAKAFTQLAATKKTIGEFRAAYWAQAAKLKALLSKAPARDRPCDHFDVDLTKASSEFPGALVEACFGAPVQSVVGPIGGESPRFDGLRHFVVFKMYQGEERNTFAEAKESLKASALEIKQQAETLKQIRDIVERRVKVDERAVTSLLQQL